MHDTYENRVFIKRKSAEANPIFAAVPPTLQKKKPHPKPPKAVLSRGRGNPKSRSKNTYKRSEPRAQKPDRKDTKGNRAVLKRQKKVGGEKSKELRKWRVETVVSSSRDRKREENKKQKETRDSRENEYKMRDERERQADALRNP